MTMHVPASIEQMSELDMGSAQAISAAASRAPSTVSPSPENRYRQGQEPKTLFDRVEAFVSRLSVRDNFWHSICSFIWLPLAFFSGIRTKQIGDDRFQAILPF